MNRFLFITLLLLQVWGCSDVTRESPLKFEKMVLIPAGEFLLGMDAGTSDPSFLSDRTSSQNAHPRQKVNLNAFYIDAFEVTYGDFIRFKPQARYENSRLDHPMRGVSWYEAEAYCFWIGKRLPTEMEWEKAARGEDGRLFVWGNDFDEEKANFGKKVRTIGSLESDRSVYGIYDMNGNVAEWTDSWYGPYPGNLYQDPHYGSQLKVIRGGTINKRTHGFLKEFSLLPYRNTAPPEIRAWDTGFRCARDIPPVTAEN